MRMRIAALSVLSATASVLILSACAIPLMGTTDFFGQVDLERTVEYLLREQGRQDLVAVECPNPLPIRAKETTRCVARDTAGAFTKVTVVVTHAASGRGRISVEVDEERQ